MEQKIIILILSSFIMTLALGISIYFLGYNNAKNDAEFQMNELKKELSTIKSSREYKATLRCQDAGIWEAECMAFELNELRR